MSIFTREGEFKEQIPLFRNGKYIGRASLDQLQEILESGGYIRTDYHEERFRILLHDRRQWGFEKYFGVPKPEEIEEIHVTRREIHPPHKIAGLEIGVWY